MKILNIEIEERTSLTVSLVYKDELTCLPIDITGYSALMQVRTSFGSDVSPLLELSTANGRITLGGTAGTVDIQFLPGDTDDSVASTGWTQGSYDVFLTDTSGNEIKIAKGFVTIARSATVVGT